MNLKQAWIAFLHPSREKLILALAVFLMWAVLGLLFVYHGYRQTWVLWNLPTLWPYFGDLRLIPGMVESLQRGLDPTLHNLGDPLNRDFNYPRIWYLAALVGISHEDTLWLGILLIVSFFFGALSFPGRLTRLAIPFFLLVLFSPACMLLYERGNVDLLIFAMCAVALALWETSTWASALVILGAAALKLYPILGLGVFAFKDRRTFGIVVPAVLLPFIAYLALTTQNAAAAWNRTERGRDISYGATVWVTQYDYRAIKAAEVSGGGSNVVARAPQAWRWASYLTAGGLVLGLFWKGLRTQARLRSGQPRNMAAFWMGGGIYCGTFLLGNNWDYRLAFLLLLLPVLAEWRETAQARRRALALAVLILIIVSTWYMRWNTFLYQDVSPFYLMFFIIDEVVDWTLLGMVSYLLGASAPEWLRLLVVRSERLGDDAVPAERGADALSERPREIRVVG